MSQPFQFQCRYVSGGNLTCFETLIDSFRPTKLFESFLSGERFGPVHSGVICGREKMIEQNKSPNFPALLQQPIWRSDIVEQSAPDKHAAIETPRRCWVFATRESLDIPRDPAYENIS